MAQAAAARAVNALSSSRAETTDPTTGGDARDLRAHGSIQTAPGRAPAGPRRSGATYIAGFAVAWNSFVAFWTASALASGGGLIFAAFSIPFWLAGKEVATSAFDEIFEASRLEIDAFKFEFTRTATGLVSDGRDGDVQDVSGCRMVVESVNNGEPSVCLELEVGAEPVRFGSGFAAGGARVRVRRGELVLGRPERDVAAGLTRLPSVTRATTGRIGAARRRRPRRDRLAKLYSYQIEPHRTPLC